MLHIKSLKWCFGIVLPLGLSACINMPYSEQPHRQSYEHMRGHAQDQMQMQHQAQHPNKQKMHKSKQLKQKTYASKDPTQQATPGPASKAAPQIPVIQ